MKKDVILHCKNGQKLEVSLARPFRCEENELKVIMSEAGAQIIFLFDELSGILFLNGTCPTDVALSDGNLEEVVTIDNTHYLVHAETAGKSSEGFYAIPAGKEISWSYAFFISNGVKMRSQKRQVGKILSDAGVISDSSIKEALNIQQKLRSRKVGEIIAETANLKQENIEKTLQDSMNKGDIPRNARVGDILVSAGLVTREQVELALANQKEGKGKKIGTLLIELGFISEEQLLQALAAKFRLRIVDLEQVTPSRETLSIISKDMVNKLQVFPIESSSRNFVVATSSPTDLTIIDNIHFITNRHVELVVATAAQIAEAIDKFYNIKDASPVDALIGEMGNVLAMVEEDEKSEESMIVQPDSRMITFVNQVLIDAYKKGASDIHFEPGMGKEPFTIRYRVDGECYIAHRIDSTHKAAILSRLKIISDLDIAERRRPQSGKIMLRYEGRKIEYRRGHPHSRQPGGRGTPYPRRFKASFFRCYGFFKFKPGQIPGNHRETLWHRPLCRPDRLWQDHKPPFGPRTHKYAGPQDLDG